MQDDLTQLAIKYGTDKWGKHHYTPVYYELFKNRRETVKKVIEIGIAEGAGVRMFRDFFSHAMIVGAEVDPERMVIEKRIASIIIDQSSEPALRALVEFTGSDVDLVVDDGSHKPEHQVFTCLTLMSLLDDNVTYVIEDVADYGVYDKLRRHPEFKVSTTKLSNRYDDRLVIVKRRIDIE